MHPSLKYNRLKTFYILILVIFFGLFITSFNSLLTKSIIIDTREEFNSKIKTTGYWVLPSIVIDDMGGGDYSWEEATLEPWCNGSGTLNDPYIIQNITFNWGFMQDNLLIKNSISYFKIENCTFTNSYSGRYGIHLNNVSNGQLTDNKFFDNNRGLYLENCKDCSILGNILNNTDGIALGVGFSNNILISENVLDFFSIGMYLYKNEDTKILGNNATNGYNGIEIYNNNRSQISRNTVLHQNFIGMRINYCLNTSVWGNLATYCSYGIFLEYANEVNVTGNYAGYNSRGFNLRYSNYNNLTNNYVYHNDYGIYLEESNYNIITSNIIFYSGIACIKEEVNCIDNQIYGNTCIENIEPLIFGYNFYFIIGILAISLIILTRKNQTK